MYNAPFILSAALHIPDGFLSIPIALVGILLAVLIISYALRQSRDLLGERQIPLLGVMAAFIFAAQAINFPVLGGTSGHLLGAALVTIIAGPWPAVLVLTVVVGLQSLIFQDGGLLAVGWNLVNMAGLAVLSAALTYSVTRRMFGNKRSGLILATAAAAWVSVVLSATSAGLALALSDPGLVAAVPAMAGIHAVIGMGEALITVAAVLLVAKSRPVVIESAPKKSQLRSVYLIALGLIGAVALAGFSVFASPDPDGLERVAIDLDFADRALEPVYRILPDYSIPGIQSDFGGLIAIVIGISLSIIGILLIGLIVRQSQKRRSETLDDPTQAQ